MNGIKQLAKEIGKYRDSLGIKIAETIWDFLQPPPYVLENTYKGKSLETREVDVMPEETAQKRLGTRYPVLGFCDPKKNGKVYLTTNPLNLDGDIRKYVAWHEDGHHVYEANGKLKSIYPQEEVFCDVYALDKFIKNYGMENVEKLVKTGIVNRNALRLYKNHLSKVKQAWWN